MNENEKFNFHPSYYIKEYLEEMDITQDEFAKRLGVSGKQISLILNQNASITPDIAYKLSKLLGTSVLLWLTLQAKYDAVVVEQKDLEKFEEEKKIYKMIDKKFLSRLGIIDEKDKIEVGVTKLREKSMVSSLLLHKNKDMLSLFKSSTNKEEKLETIVCRNVWVSIAFTLAKKEIVKDFDENKLLNSIPLFRSFTTKEPEMFYPIMKNILSECGVILVMLPSLKNSNINGVVKWVNSNNVMMALNTRGSYNDRFWFSFFHELKHVLQKAKRKAIYNFDNNIIDELYEYDADRFSSETLIPSERLKELSRYDRYSIIEFAKKINIHPGIVVGRLQKENKIKYSQLNNLKEKYEITLDKVF